MLKVKHVVAHIKMSPGVFSKLRDEFAHFEEPMFPAYEIRVDPTLSDEWVEIVEARTIKAHRYIRLGSQFRWKDTLYVNPLDERLLP